MGAWNQNRLTAKLEIDYPIIQRAARRVVIAEIDGRRLQLRRTRSFGAHGLAPEEIKDVIAEIRSLTPNRSQ